MSAQVWPPISHEQLVKEEEATLAAELEWLLNLLQENLASLKSGLQECVALLAPEEPGSTLALSSHRSESVKGFVTRVGARVVKGDINLRLHTLPPPRSLPSYLLHLSSPLPLPQLTHLLTLLNQSLDIIDISTWTGDPHSGPFIAGQLKLLSDTISEACQTLKGGSSDSNDNNNTNTNNNNNNNITNNASIPGLDWYSDSSPPDTFTPTLPANLSFHLSISDAALTLHIRTLTPTSNPPESSLSTFSLRSRLGLASRPPVHDELDQVFQWKGEEVQVREKVRVESQDPSLMAVMAKLSALGHAVAGWRVRVGIVMGVEVED